MTWFMSVHPAGGCASQQPAWGFPLLKVEILWGALSALCLSATPPPNVCTGQRQPVQLQTEVEH